MPWHRTRGRIRLIRDILRAYIRLMRRNALRPLWVILALLLLVEAWLWDHLEPIVARVVNLVPWRRLKIAVPDGLKICRPMRRSLFLSSRLSSCCR